MKDKIWPVLRVGCAATVLLLGGGPGSEPTIGSREDGPIVTADGFPGAEYAGQVVDIKKQMGPKQLIPTDPAAIIDYKVLNVEISLPPECPFPNKLPVNVRIWLD